MMMLNSYSYKRGVTGFYPKLKNPSGLVVTSIVVEKLYYTSIYIVIHYLHHDKFKNSRITKIQQVHQELSVKQI